MSDDPITDIPEPALGDDEGLAGGEVEGDLDAVTDPDGSEADRLEQLTEVPPGSEEDGYDR